MCSMGGHNISFDNQGRFYQGLPFTFLTVQVTEVNVANYPDIIKVELNVNGEKVSVELPFYLAQ